MSQNGGNDALIQGTITVEGNCVALSTGGTDVHPVVWPAGTRITAVDDVPHVVVGGEQFAVGESVSGGGGFFPRGSASVPVDIPAACGTSDEIAVFNSRSDVNQFEPDG